jgi:hypothetical protein
MEAQHRRARLLDGSIASRLAGRAFGIEHIVPREGDMDEIQRVMPVGGVDPARMGAAGRRSG